MFYSKRNSNWSPIVSNNEYLDREVRTPVRQGDFKKTQEYSEDHMSRRIDTAATDSKSLTNTTDRNRLNKSGSRRKRKNIQIRKLSKKNSRLKKSTKSLAKVDPDNDWIHERVEEEKEENEFACDDKDNRDLKDLEIEAPDLEPERRYNVQSIASIRNNSIVNNSCTYSNRSMINALGTKKEKRKLSSLRKPVNECVVMQKSMYDGRPMTVFFQYPEYCGVVRHQDNTIVYTQTEFKKQGYNLAFKVTGSTHVYNAVVNSMKNSGFTMVTR